MTPFDALRIAGFRPAAHLFSLSPPSLDWLDPSGVVGGTARRCGMRAGPDGDRAVYTLHSVRHPLGVRRRDAEAVRRSGADGRGGDGMNTEVRRRAEWWAEFWRRLGLVAALASFAFQGGLVAILCLGIANDPSPIVCGLFLLQSPTWRFLFRGLRV